MSNKYIIKNCPAYCYLGKECHNEEGQYGASCCEITDCKLKQIVEKCKKIIFLNNNVDFVDEDACKQAVGENVVANNILQLLDIQEVE